MGIQLFKANFDVEACLAQIKECLEKGWTGMGFKTVEFEEEWKKYTGYQHAYYINSSTAGLYMAVDTLKELYNWADDDEIISTPLTFISTNHAIAKNNMKVVFRRRLYSLHFFLCTSVNSLSSFVKSLFFAFLSNSYGSSK